MGRQIERGEKINLMDGINDSSLIAWVAILVVFILVWMLENESGQAN